MKKTLKQLRQEAGMTQMELAIATGMQTNSISKFETTMTCTERTALTLCHVLGIEPSDLNMKIKKEVGKAKWVAIENYFDKEEKEA